VLVPSIAVHGASLASELPRLPHGRFGYQEVVPATGASSSELLSRARVWAAAEYRSANDVIQLDDPSSGMLMVKGTFEVSYATAAVTVEHRVTVEVKDGRYRYTVSNFVLGFPKASALSDKALEEWHAYSEEGTAKVLGRVARQAGSIVENLKRAMQSPTPASSDW
jgi:hypothetical protein